MATEQRTHLVLERTERLSHGVFAALAARIAQVAAQWSADALLPMQEFEKPVSRATAETFADEIRVRLNRIVESARDD